MSKTDEKNDQTN